MPFFAVRAAALLRGLGRCSPGGSAPGRASRTSGTTRRRAARLRGAVGARPGAAVPDHHLRRGRLGHVARPALVLDHLRRAVHRGLRRSRRSRSRSCCSSRLAGEEPFKSGAPAGHRPRPRQAAARLHDAVGLRELLAVPDRLVGQHQRGDAVLPPPPAGRLAGDGDRCCSSSTSRCRSRSCSRARSSATRGRSAAVAALMLLMQLVDLFWLIGPDLVGHGARARAAAGPLDGPRGRRSGSAACGCCSSRARRARRRSCRWASPSCASSPRRGRRRTEPCEHEHEAATSGRDAHAGGTYRAGLYILGDDVRDGARWSCPMYRLLARGETAAQPPAARWSRARSSEPRRCASRGSSAPSRRVLAEFRAQEDALLTSYGWVEKDKGIARIPIDEAMRIVAERGLPKFPAPAPAAGAGGRRAGDAPRARARAPRSRSARRSPPRRWAPCRRRRGRRRPACCRRSASTSTWARAIPLDLAFKDETGQEREARATTSARSRSC